MLYRCKFWKVENWPDKMPHSSHAEWKLILIQRFHFLGKLHYGFPLIRGLSTFKLQTGGFLMLPWLNIHNIIFWLQFLKRQVTKLLYIFEANRDIFLITEIKIAWLPGCLPWPITSQWRLIKFIFFDCISVSHIGLCVKGWISCL